ncbi:MAG: glycosyl hydrolase, partial [Gemmatimonadaceae bacterium]|nr:glycosyl hydrolase [Gemmatimonadaceae bacterium]
MSLVSVLSHAVARRRRWCAPALCVLALVPAQAQRRGAAAAPPAPAIDPARYSQLAFRHIGPEGNRITSVAGVEGDPTTYYAGAASGGLWKSTDNGIHWAPVTDKLPAHSIGSVAVAPSDPNVVWIGTGEPFIRSNISVGWGMWRSTDAGKTWSKQG